MFQVVYIFEQQKDKQITYTRSLPQSRLTVTDPSWREPIGLYALNYYKSFENINVYKDKISISSQ